MNRLRPSSIAAYCLLALAASSAAIKADTPAKSDKPSDEKWLVDETVTLTPQSAPIPALRYYLFPLFTERKEGNAVPIYLRFAHERNDATKKELQEKTEQWNKLPLDQLPMREVQKYLDRWKYNLHQLELGARRRTADWSYTLDVVSPIEILLPDIQEMRLQARLLVLQARVATAQNHWGDAARTLQTGFSFCQQLSEPPFLITGLVGIVNADQFTGCVLEWMQRPQAPNLYWALTALPRPLISLRRASEFEERIQEIQFPDLADVHRSRTPAEWDAALVRVRAEIARIAAMNPRDKGKSLPPRNGVSDPAAQSPDLPVARNYLIEKMGMPAAQVDAMVPAQVLLVYIHDYSRVLRDDFFKAAYLPYAAARPVYAAAQRRLQEAPDTEATRLVRLLLPAMPKVDLAQVRLERKLAALRVLEALRIYAAAHDSHLPDRLADVTEVPVPNDPATDKAFDYRREGDTATLISRIDGEPLKDTGLRYRITLRK